MSRVEWPTFSGKVYSRITLSRNVASKYQRLQNSAGMDNQRKQKKTARE